MLEGLHVERVVVVDGGLARRGLHEDAGQLRHLLQVLLEQLWVQVDHDGGREEEDELAYDVGAAQSLDGLYGAGGAQLLEHLEELLEVVGKVLQARFLPDHDAAVEAGELDEAVESVMR